MENNKESYKQIIKTTSLFGGVQVIQILTTIIRGKLVALFLGTTGMGINTLYTSVTTLIVQISSFGLNFSAVRDISQASERGNIDARNKIIKIFRRWMYFCALFGTIIICLSSKWLSQFTFGNNQYTVGFICLSLMVILVTLSNSNIAVLQGTRRLHDIAKASVLGSIIGLIFCIPFYYFYKEDGIIPALIISAFFTFIFSTYFSREIKVDQLHLSINETIKGGAEMAKLGVAMMAATLIGTAANYLVNAYISNFGTLSDVGLFGAGISITNQYVGVVFTAMAVDYFPRLSSVCNEKKKIRVMVNQQAEIVLLIVSPLLVGMMLTAPLLIRILLSSDFLVISDFVCWVAFSMLFKSASFAMGYISFAKGDKKIFFFFEGLFNSLLMLISSIVGYKLGGITGLAKGILFCNVLYFINISILSKVRYDFEISRSFFKMFMLSILLLGLVLLIVLNYSNIIGYTLGGLIFLLSILHSFITLDARIQLKSLLLSKINRK